MPRASPRDNGCPQRHLLVTLGTAPQVLGRAGASQGLNPSLSPFSPHLCKVCQQRDLFFFSFLGSNCYKQVFAGQRGWASWQWACGRCLPLGPDGREGPSKGLCSSCSPCSSHPISSPQTRGQVHSRHTPSCVLPLNSKPAHPGSGPPASTCPSALFVTKPPRLSHVEHLPAVSWLSLSPLLPPLSSYSSSCGAFHRAGRLSICPAQPSSSGVPSHLPRLRRRPAGPQGGDAGRRWLPPGSLCFFLISASRSHC